MEDCKKKKLAFVCNVDSFFLSHRLPLAEEAIKLGYNVFLLTKNTGLKEEFKKKGIVFIDIPFQRSGTNPFHELKCIYMLFRSYKKYKFDLVHHITLKSALLGSLAAKLSGIKNVINAISGFGYNFTDNRDGVLQKIIKGLFNPAFKSNSFHFILQNSDDIIQVVDLGVVPLKNIHLIEGSGIDLNQYKYCPPKKNKKKVFLFPARLLYDKGLKELLVAAENLYLQYFGKIKFVLVGDVDPDNLASISVESLKTYLVDDYIEWKGFQKDMYSVYCQSDIVILPSYREGLPKSLIEACAVGRPIITTNAPGCKSCIWKNSENGILVMPKDVETLQKAIVDLYKLSDESLILMGRSSRLLAEEKFSIEKVKKMTFSIYDILLK